jgi:S-DNA-T family DNA segregation ATPase FtsK/SpoIIIE
MRQQGTRLRKDSIRGSSLGSRLSGLLSTFWSGQSRPIWMVLLSALLVAVDLAGTRWGWTPITRRALGWGAFSLLAFLIGVGVALLVGRRQRRRLRWEPLAGLGIVVIVLMALSHPRDAGPEPFLLALRGGGGGVVGWSISSFLSELLGPWIARILLLIVAAFGAWVAWRWMPPGGKDRILSLARAAWARFAISAPTGEGSESGAPEMAEDSPLEAPQAGRRARSSSRRTRGKGSKRASSSGRRADLQRDQQLPALDLLHLDRSREFGDSNADYKAEIIEQTLHDFGVPAKVVEVKKGPTVTQFGVQPLTVPLRTADGTVQERRVSVRRIVRLSNDLALALAASPLRIEAPAPGYPYVGIEVPNDRVALVALRGVMESPEFTDLARETALAIAIGRDVSGEPVVGDLAGMPHLLIAGATGSGKSVCIHSVVTCLLLNNTPEALRLLLIDPKMVELPGYNGVPHLLAPVVVQLEQAVGALAWLTLQMDERYRMFHSVQARGIADYNRIAQRRPGMEPLPRIVLVIDELADMMMVASDDVEKSICRLAQMARATGIHVIIATQRPSVDVVTGLIKANFPARVAFKVASQVDSRVILDQPGAEQLLGRGDLLFMSPNSSSPLRAQGCFVSARETQKVVRHWVDQAGAGASGTEAPWAGLPLGGERGDDLFPQAVEIIRETERVSVSFLQRRLRIGYPRAARLVEMLEDAGLVGPDEGGGRGRQVLESASEGVQESL